MVLLLQLILLDVNHHAWLHVRTRTDDHSHIKAVLVGEDNAPIASGSHDWENRLENGIWTYSLDDIWSGLRDSYKKLAADVYEMLRCSREAHS